MPKLAFAPKLAAGPTPNAPSSASVKLRLAGEPAYAAMPIGMLPVAEPAGMTTAPLAAPV